MQSNLERSRILIDELRLTTMWQLFGISTLLAWLWMVVSIFGRPTMAASAFAVAFLMVMGVLITRFATRRFPAFGLPLFVLTSVTAITLAIYLVGTAELAYLYAVPILVAGALIHPSVAFMGATGLGIFLISPWGQQIGDLFLPGVLLVLCFTALIAWAFARTFFTVVEWMFESYLLAERQTREAQEHRAELQKVLKSLDLAYYRLRRANEALTWARGQAEEARQAKARFVANVSHELRTPLNLIIGFSEMIVTAPESYGQPLPPVYRGDLNAIYRNAKHLSSLIDDVLDLSQIEADRMPLSKEDGDLRQIVEEATNMVRGMVEAKGLALQVELPPAPVRMPLDITRIRQVILNLLSNAVRFTGSGGIAVSLTLSDEAAIVGVKDTGAGIPADKIAQLFEEFYQVDDSIRREHGGTGLGLAISKRFVELHGGRIWVESVESQGSTFCFSLPLYHPQQEQLAHSKWDAQPATSAERILVVYHVDSSAATLIQRRLGEYQVKPVSSLPEMVEVVQRWRPTAVIVEMASREEAAASLASSGCSDIPLISCPLFTQPKMADRLHIADYLLKPVTPEALRRALDNLLPSIHTVLICDDDPAMVRLLARVVQAEWTEVRVLQAHNGRMALEIAHREHPDLILLDLMMPEMSGVEVLNQMQEDPLLIEIPVIVITATELGEEVAQFSGEMLVTIPQPLAASEWLNILGALTASLRPTPDPDGANGSAFAAAHPDGPAFANNRLRPKLPPGPVH
ncbi:MAG: response regulator [Caldilineaceae bacterium]|nr:response regulator [Caldilineaceae bacterium]